MSHFVRHGADRELAGVLAQALGNKFKRVAAAVAGMGHPFVALPRDQVQCPSDEIDRKYDVALLDLSADCQTCRSCIELIAQEIAIGAQTLFAHVQIMTQESRGVNRSRPSQSRRFDFLPLQPYYWFNRARPAFDIHHQNNTIND